MFHLRHWNPWSSQSEALLPRCTELWGSSVRTSMRCLFIFDTDRPPKGGVIPNHPQPLSKTDLVYSIVGLTPFFPSFFIASFGHAEPCNNQFFPTKTKQLQDLLILPFKSIARQQDLPRCHILKSATGERVAKGDALGMK